MSLSLITRKFTVEEYEKMTTQGIIKPDEKVELIRGEIIKIVQQCFTCFCFLLLRIHFSARI